MFLAGRNNLPKEGRILAKSQRVVIPYKEQHSNRREQQVKSKKETIVGNKLWKLSTKKKKISSLYQQMEIDCEPQIQAMKVVLNYLVGIFKTKSKKENTK